MKQSNVPATRTVAAFSLATLLASSAFAHAGHELASGAAAGFMHPLTGLDHLLALVSSGVLLASCTPRARWIGAGALAAALLLGAVLGRLGHYLPALEVILAFSVVVAGLAVAARQPLGSAGWLLVGMTGFALFHGYAHGAEATGEVSAFVAAFLASSLIIVGGTLFVAQRIVHSAAWRMLLGVAVAASGAGMLASVAL